MFTCNLILGFMEDNLKHGITFWTFPKDFKLSLKMYKKQPVTGAVILENI